MPTHPSDLPRRNPDHQGESLDVLIDDSTRTYECKLPDRYTAHDSGICTDRSTAPDNGASIRPLADDRRTRVVDISKHHAWPAEDIVLQRHRVVDGDVVLDFDVVADDHVAADENVLTERTVGADAGAAADMDPMPDPRAFAERRSVVDDGGLVNGRRHAQ